MIKIAITDDNSTFRESLRQVFEVFEGFEILFEATDGTEAVHFVERMTERPQLILMDVEMPKMNGIEATQKIKKIAPATKILMLTVVENDDKIMEALQLGADGYLLKEEKPEKIIAAIQQALEGRLPMSPVVARNTLNLLRKQPVHSQLKKPEDYQLSRRELEILEQLAIGKNYNSIAELLFISPKTVRNHIENIYRKLDVHSKIEASNLAHQNRWFK